MTKRDFAGLERDQEIPESIRREDTRSVFRKIRDYHNDAQRVLWWPYAPLAIVALLLCWAPFVPEMLFLVSIAFYLGNTSFKKRGWDAPFRVPAYLGRLGFKDKTTGSKGAGVIYLGMGRGKLDGGREVWASASDVRTHNMVVGTTGSGKTELMFGSVFNALVVNSGGIMVDGKASPKTFDRILGMARMFGREEDLLLMNFIMGGQDYRGYSATKLSHTYNPFGLGSSAMKAELMSSLLAGVGGGGQNGDFWKDRANSFLESLMLPLSELAAHGHVLFNPRLLVEFLSLENIENLVFFGLVRGEGGRVIDLSVVDPSCLAKVLKAGMNLKLFVEQLPGYAMARPKKPNKFVDTPEAEINAALDGGDESVRDFVERYVAANRGATDDDDAPNPQQQQARVRVIEQFGFISMQLVRAVGNLTFVYGHIFNDEIGEINFKDLFLNRRIMYVTIPSLERNPSNMGMLGKLAVASLKAVMANQLEAPFEGDRRQIVEGRPSNSSMPFNIILDEYGYYVTEGFAVMPAQAREFGVAITIGVQDLESMSKASKEEGEATWLNTNLRFAGRTTGGAETDTFKKLDGAAADAYAASSGTTIYRRGQVGGAYSRGDELRTERERRLNVGDLNAQENGAFHLIVGSKTEARPDGTSAGTVRVVRYQAFYTGPIQPVGRWRLTHFVQVRPPRAERIRAAQQAEETERYLQLLARDGVSEWMEEWGKETGLRIKGDLVDEFLSRLGRLGRFDESAVRQVLAAMEGERSLTMARQYFSTRAGAIRKTYQEYLMTEGLSKEEEMRAMRVFEAVFERQMARTMAHWSMALQAHSASQAGAQVLLSKRAA